MADLAPWIRAGKALLLAGLLIFLALKCVLPALTEITDDFPEYFTSARSIREGYPAVKLYDADWFRGQTHRYGVGHQDNPGEFTPYPPPTALLLTPLAGFQPLTALRIVTALNVLCLMGAALLLRSIFAWRMIDAALFILLSGWALRSGLRFGHPYILISTLCLLGYYLHLQGRPWLAGLCIGGLAPIKYFPVMILAGFGLCRQWRVLLGGVIAVAAVASISIGALGWKVHRMFLIEVLPNHLSGHLIASPRFIAVFQSFDTLFERLFIFDAVRNPHPWLQAPAAAAVATVATKLLLLVAAAVTMIKLSRGAPARTLAPTIGILGVLVLLIAPGSGTYAFVLLWLPVALLMDYFLSEQARVAAYLVLCSYVFIGFIPYGRTHEFEGDGGFSILAYPRLILLLAMFAVCICTVVARPNQPAVAHV